MDNNIRPWGFFKVVYEESDKKVKILSVNPNGILSKQSHKYRKEDWIVLSGVAEIEINNSWYRLLPDQKITINIGDVHRVKNTSLKQLNILEIQTGSYLGEDDITRYEDEYGRK
jgi:mannose-6-phosphate isomerase-like protein (cupin superfamily)